MKHFQSVLAFGDSHVAGCELSDEVPLADYISGKVTIEEADAPGKRLAFPQIVADKLRVPCYNYAMSGGSNARSLRLLIQAVQEHPNSLVLFGYTCTDRTEFYYPDEGNFIGRDKDNFIQVGLQWEGRIKREGMKHPINDLFINSILRPYNNFNDLMFVVDNICTMYATDFLHLPLVTSEFNDTDNVFDFESHGSYLTWCVEKKFKQLPYLHYDQEAHKKLAELILKEIA
jgi:hypothetical protein